VIDLFLFTNQLNTALDAEKAGIDSIIIDCEHKGKIVRQQGYDIEINDNKLSDIKKLSSSLNIPVTVRLNSWKMGAKQEVDLAIENGASIIMLPMADTVLEVEAFLKAVKNRVKTIIQIETPQLVNDLSAFSQLSWDYAYIGLNDLMIAYGYRHLWEPLINGLASGICESLKGRKYGLGGTTIVGGGFPIQSNLLLHEYVRLGCSLSFLRRSFSREILDRAMTEEISLIRQFIKVSSKRGANAVETDRVCLLDSIVSSYAP